MPAGQPNSFVPYNFVLENEKYKNWGSGTSLNSPPPQQKLGVGTEPENQPLTLRVNRSETHTPSNSVAAAGCSFVSCVETHTQLRSVASGSQVGHGSGCQPLSPALGDDSSQLTDVPASSLPPPIPSLCSTSDW